MVEVAEERRAGGVDDLDRRVGLARALVVWIGYGGSIDQLRAGLAEISLDLVRGDPLWRLARGEPARPR